MLRPEDLALVKRVLEQDPDALAEFAERMRCVYRLLKVRNSRAGAPLDRAALEDLAQDVLASMWRRLPQYRGDASLETWTFRFCEFGFRNALRRHAIRRSVHSVDPEELGGVEDVSEESAVDHERVTQAIDALPDTEAAIVRAKQFDDLTFDEIAARLDLSANTAKTRDYRALRRLKTALAPEEGS